MSVKSRVTDQLGLKYNNYSYFGHAYKLLDFHSAGPEMTESAKRTLPLDCHYNTISDDKCQQIVDLCQQEHIEPEFLVITCSGEKPFDQKNLKPLESLTSIKTVTFQGWHCNDGDYWHCRQRREFNVAGIPSSVENLYIEYSFVSLQTLSAIASLPNLKTLTFGRTSLPKIEHGPSESAYNFDGLIETLRNWKLESLSFDCEMRISMDILKCLPKNLRHLRFVDSFPLRDNNGKDVEWDILCPTLESIYFSFIDSDIQLWHNLTNRLPLTITCFDVGGGFWNLSDNEVLQVLKHLPDIEDVGIFTYCVLSVDFFEWAKFQHNRIRIRTKKEYMTTCKRSKDQNNEFVAKYTPHVTFV